MSNLRTKQAPYKTLKLLSGNDTALSWTGAAQTVDKHEDCGLTTTVDIRQDDNAAIVTFYGTTTANQSLDWMLVGWREGGPAEHIATGTALLGTQRVATGTSTTLYADTITISSQTWPKTVSVVDSGNDRIAKLVFDLCGIAWIAAVCDNSGTSGTTTTAARISFF